MRRLPPGTSFDVIREVMFTADAAA